MPGVAGLGQLQRGLEALVPVADAALPAAAADDASVVRAFEGRCNWPRGRGSSIAALVFPGDNIGGSSSVHSQRLVGDVVETGVGKRLWHGRREGNVSKPEL